MIRSYVIHLSKSTAREALIADLQKALPNCDVLDAIDGREMTDSVLRRVAKNRLAKPHYPFPLMPSEIGCFLSHRKAWAAIANADAPFGFVAEDDVAVRPGFAQALSAAIELGTEDKLIRFPMREREKPDQSILIQNGIHLFRPKEIGLTAALYLLGRKAAQKLIDKSETFDRPVDTWLQMRWDTGVDSLTVWPSHIISAATSHGGSTIQSKRSRLEQVARTWHRARYRAKITKLSRTS
ncbi:MAG: glycosyltransferase family 25 protein [Cognatishimia sp.]